MILVVDDSVEALEMIALILEDGGYEVVCTSDPEQALKICREVNFDLVLCDLYFDGPPDAGIAGINVIWTLSEEFPRMPLIAMSGLVEGSALQKMNSSGVVGVLSKPFDRNGLLSQIETALRSHRPSAVISLT